jgi:site-specific recombinase XerD
MDGLARSAPDPTSNAELVNEFLAHCKAKGLSPRTYRDAYGYPLTRVLLPFCERQAITNLDQLDGRALDRLASELYDRDPPLSKASVKSYLKSVNQLLSWWEKETEKSKGGRAQLPKLRKPLREVLSRPQLADLEGAAPAERDRLIIRLLADTGARESEIARLGISALVERDRTYFVKVKGKTGERMPPVSPALFRRLKHYAEKGRPRDAESEQMFVTLRRRRGGYQPLTESAVYQVVRTAAGRGGFEGRLYPHLIRHSAITWMVSRGMQPVAICDIVGCSLPVVMEVYTHLGDEQRYRAMMDVMRDAD